MGCCYYYILLLSLSSAALSLKLNQNRYCHHYCNPDKDFTGCTNTFYSRSAYSLSARLLRGKPLPSWNQWRHCWKRQFLECDGGFRGTGQEALGGGLTMTKGSERQGLEGPPVSSPQGSGSFIGRCPESAAIPHILASTDLPVLFITYEELWVQLIKKREEVVLQIERPLPRVPCMEPILRPGRPVRFVFPQHVWASMGLGVCFYFSFFTLLGFILFFYF